MTNRKRDEDPAALDRFFLEYRDVLETYCAAPWGSLARRHAQAALAYAARSHFHYADSTSNTDMIRSLLRAYRKRTSPRSGNA